MPPYPRAGCRRTNALRLPAKSRSPSRASATASVQTLSSVKQQAEWNSGKSRGGPTRPSNREPIMSPAIAPSMLDRLKDCAKVNSMSKVKAALTERLQKDRSLHKSLEQVINYLNL